MRRRACRSGSHAYGPPVRSGAGISRTVCKYCGSVEIDLRDGRLEPLGSNDGLDVGAVRATGRGRSALTDRPGALFGATSRVSLFEIRLAVDAGLYELDAAPRSGRRD